MPFIKPSEGYAPARISVLIMGEPNSGKTTLALGLPNVAIVDCEDGFTRSGYDPNVHTNLKGVFNAKTPYDPATRSSGVTELRDALLNGFIQENEIDTIVIDTAGTLVDLIELHLMKENPFYATQKGTMQKWGAVKNMFNEIRKLVYDSGANLLFIAHTGRTNIINGKEKVERVTPRISGSAKNEIIQSMSAIGYYDIKDGGRVLTFTATSELEVKNPCNNCLPDYVIEQGGEAAILDVFRTLQNSMRRAPAGTIVLPSGDYGDTDLMLSMADIVEMVNERTAPPPVTEAKIRSLVDGATTVEDLYAAKDVILKAVHLDRASFAKLLNARASNLGYVFAKEHNAYIPIPAAAPENVEFSTQGEAVNNG